jgi:hypothetical protein
MLMMIGVLVGLAVPADQSALVLEISTPQREVLVGEPVKLTVRLKAKTDVHGIPLDAEEELPVQFLRVLVDDGTQVRTYVEFPRQIVEQVLVAESLRPGEERAMNIVLFNGGYLEASTAPPRSSFLFPVSGRFSIRLDYAGRQARATSNALRFTVKAPAGEDREILEAVRREPRILDASGDAAAQAKARDLVERFPHSAYLRWTRLRMLEHKTNAPDRDLGPQGREAVLRLDNVDRERHWVREYQRVAEELLSSGDWGPFEEEALAVGLLAAQGAGDKEKAAAAKATLYEKYPDSPTVKRLKARESGEAPADDDNEPMLRPVKPKPSPNP